MKLGSSRRCLADGNYFAAKFFPLHKTKVRHEAARPSQLGWKIMLFPRPGCYNLLLLRVTGAGRQEISAVRNVGVRY